MKVSKSQMLVITEGEAADFKIILSARALADFDTATQIRAFKRMLWSVRVIPNLEQNMFLQWVTEKRLIEPVTKRNGKQWWLGLRGELSDPIN